MHEIKSGFYGIEMNQGELDQKPSRNSSCFFIAVRNHDEKFVKKLALQLLQTDCRRYDFYGANARLWEMCFDLVDIEINPDSTIETVALTSEWGDMESFVEALSLGLLESDDCYLFYDDVSVYQQVLSISNVFHASL